MTPPRTRTCPLLLLLALAVLAAGCDSADSPRVGITGRWAGTLTSTLDPTQQYAVEMELFDDGTLVVGSGTVGLPTETLAFSIPNGTFVPYTVSLELLFGRPPLGRLSGNVSTTLDRIEGTLSGPGLANGEVELMLSLRKAG